MEIWRSALPATAALAASIVFGQTTLRADVRPTDAFGVRVRPAVYTRSIDATKTPNPVKLVDAAPTKKPVVTTVGWRHRYGHYGYGPACGPYGCWAGAISPRAAYYRSFYGVYAYPPFYSSYWPAYYGVGYAPLYHRVSYAPIYPPAYYAGYRGRYPLGWAGCCYW